VSQRSKWEDSNGIDFGGKNFVDMNWIKVAQGRLNSHISVVMIMKFLIP
jgi:hypothetical protein